jgi:hypothetical protein
MADSKRPKRLQINVQLEGDDADRFQAYKDKEFLKTTAEAARKLILERLAEVIPKAKAA